MAKLTNKVQNKLEALKDDKIVAELWNNYKNFYRKEYRTAEEDSNRLGKFLNNLKIILKENTRFDEGTKKFKLHMNEYGDMDLPEFRQKMMGLKTSRRNYIRSLPIIQRRKRFLLDSVKEKVKKIKDKFNKALRPGKNRTDDYDTSNVTRSPKTTKRTMLRTFSRASVDNRPYMNPIENQGRCG